MSMIKLATVYEICYFQNIKLVFLWKERATICLEWIIKWLFNFIKFLLLFDFFIKVFKIK